MSGTWRRVETKFPDGLTQTLIEQTPDGLLWLGNGGNMRSLTARQVATLRKMLDAAVPDRPSQEVIRLAPYGDGEPPRYFDGRFRRGAA